MRALTTTLTAVVAAAALLAAGPASAACKKMGFLVNDYGKDGPSKDAQALLDKHVAEWAAQNGIKNYTIGKKDVTCELYLNLILFDEHTCTASANVCWDEPGKEKPAKSAKPKDASEPAKAADAEKKSSEKKPAQAEAEKPAAQQAEKAAEPAPAAIETGTLPAAEAKPAAAPAASSDDAAERAAAAAERAAQAAERAAAAAEKAAAASNPAPSQLEMPGFGAGKPADVAPVTPVEPKS